MGVNHGKSLPSIKLFKIFRVKSIAPGYTLPGSAITSHVTLGKVFIIPMV